MSYNAASIRILTESEAADRFQWKLIDILATHYGKPKAWIERSIRACEGAGIDVQYFIDKYLKKLDVPMDSDVNLESKIQQGLLKEEDYYN